MSRRKIGIALAAGGAKGLAYIPFLSALDEMGIEPAMIAGSSIGAVVGGFYAAGTTAQDMFEILSQFRPKDVTSFLSFNWSGTGIVAGKAVQGFLQEHLPVKTFEETRFPLKVVATDYWRREQVILDTGPLAEAIHASAAFPGIFEPLVKDGRVLVDGGAANPLPSDLLKEECDFLIALNVSNRSEDPDSTEVPGSGLMMFNTFRILKDRLAEIAVERYPIDIYFRMELPFVETLDFHKYKEILDHVGPEVERFQNELEEKLGDG